MVAQGSTPLPGPGLHPWAGSESRQLGICGQKEKAYQREGKIRMEIRRAKQRPERQRKISGAKGLVLWKRSAYLRNH